MLLFFSNFCEAVFMPWSKGCVKITIAKGVSKSSLPWLMAPINKIWWPSEPWFPSRKWLISSASVSKQILSYPRMESSGVVSFRMDSGDWIITCLPICLVSSELPILSSRATAFYQVTWGNYFPILCRDGLPICSMDWWTMAGDEGKCLICYFQPLPGFLGTFWGW
jgi:hypothetical protein